MRQIIDRFRCERYVCNKAESPFAVAAEKDATHRCKCATQSAAAAAPCAADASPAHMGRADTPARGGEHMTEMTTRAGSRAQADLPPEASTAAPSPRALPPAPAACTRCSCSALGRGLSRPPQPSAASGQLAARKGAREDAREGALDVMRHGQRGARWAAFECVHNPQLSVGNGMHVKVQCLRTPWAGPSANPCARRSRPVLGKVQREAGTACALMRQCNRGVSHRCETWLSSAGGEGRRLGPSHVDASAKQPDAAGERHDVVCRALPRPHAFEGAHGP